MRRYVVQRCAPAHVCGRWTRRRPATRRTCARILTRVYAALRAVCLKDQTVQCCDAMRCDAMRCDAMRCVGAAYNMHAAHPVSRARHCNELWHVGRRVLAACSMSHVARCTVAQLRCCESVPFVALPLYASDRPRKCPLHARTDHAQATQTSAGEPQRAAVCWGQLAPRRCTSARQ
jgi:hypothetical protein